jgi:hypothetical protein
VRVLLARVEAAGTDIFGDAHFESAFVDVEA